MYIDRETIIHLGATLFVLCALVFIGALALRIWQKRPRKAQEVYVFDMTKFVQNMAAFREQEEALYRQELALGNEVVRLRREIEALEYDVRDEAEQVLEQYQEQLKAKGE